MRKEDVNFLVCPECKGKLHYMENKKHLRCMECGREYPVIDGIPILLPEKEAKNVLRNSDSCNRSY